MTDPDEADRRIEAKERELARLQFEETTWRQLEANLTRDRLKRTLCIGAQAARRVLDDLASSFDASVDQMAEDIAGGQEER
jgi:hypothetical protein